MPELPERLPAGDPFAGTVVQAGDYTLLTSDLLPDVEILYTGHFIVRYGIIYLERPVYSIVPGLVALDYGDLMRGDEALEFLLKHSTQHPRADVIGYRNDGEDDMIPVKKLDPVRPVDVLLYSSPAATSPLALLDAFIGSDAQHLRHACKSTCQYFQRSNSGMQVKRRRNRRMKNHE